MVENRKFPRLAGTYLAAVSAADGSCGDWWSMGRTIDLSLTGLALAVDSGAICVGLVDEARVTVALSIQDTVVELTGCLIRRAGAGGEPFEFAIAFSEKSSAYWKALSLSFADAAPTA